MEWIGTSPPSAYCSVNLWRPTVPRSLSYPAIIRISYPHCAY